MSSCRHCSRQSLIDRAHGPVERRVALAQGRRAPGGFRQRQRRNSVRPISRDTTAAKYIGRIESALDRIAENPDLLREEPQFAESLRFYRVEKHVLACDVQEELVYVLTVLHTSMDIPTRLARLQPQLLLEARLLHEKLALGMRHS
ncbi:MAG: type II toxin-antitoxin system RelE/ParE family toxin [Pirellulales bacterium]|nr:type II toxin-antitoxin system RelE/ParE family toxin [Pirellulales bacterium]